MAPKTGGRLQSVNVKLGDRVRRGQVIAKVEDREIVEQVRQAEASHKVAEATIRRSEADLSLALTNVERVAQSLRAASCSPSSSSTTPKRATRRPSRTLDLVAARSCPVRVAPARAPHQPGQHQCRLPGRRVRVKRIVDPGAWVSQNAAVVSVVDISSLRLVANVVEKDLRAVNAGDQAIVEVDAYPGEKFNGRIARVSPILDPATRTAPMEVEIPNSESG